jgi:hypothetical protein
MSVTPTPRLMRCNPSSSDLMREISVKMRYQGSVTVPVLGSVSGCVGGGRESAINAAVASNSIFHPARDKSHSPQRPLLGRQDPKSDDCAPSAFGLSLDHDCPNDQ